ncbi:hypothetical protein NKDENANG_00563 [Candidatus Entotheonellaceae bacterium PAL068K]
MLSPTVWLACPPATSSPRPRLQRERNLQADPRATLLAELWDRHDGSALWWVRAGLHGLPEPEHDATHRLADELARRYPLYLDRPFHRLLGFEIVGLTGWAAAR